MGDRPSLRDRQMEFAAHLRDPAVFPAPEGIEDRRLEVYRDLFIGSISSLLSSTFPVMKQLYDDADWRELMRSFYSTHRSKTPIFMEVPQEFLAYLMEEHETRDCDPPFLLELAHYEWVELATSIDDQEIDWDRMDPQGDTLEGCPFLSPWVNNLAYQYPVQHISAKFRPESPPAEPTRLVVYRDLKDEVGFLEVNPVTGRLLELIAENTSSSGRELLAAISAELNHPNPDTVIKGGQEILTRLRRHDVLLGTWKENTN